MSIETLNIVGDRIKSNSLIQNKFTGNIGTYTINVLFDSTWDIYEKFVSFTINDEPLEPQLIINDTITIPSEVFISPCECLFGFFGTNLNEDIKRISTNRMSFTVLQGFIY